MFLVNSSFFLFNLNKMKNFLEKKLIKEFLAIKKIEIHLQYDFKILEKLKLFFACYY